jgi:hypothetical protein
LLVVISCFTPSFIAATPAVLQVMHGNNP